jgi:hypothetical protein
VQGNSKVEVQVTLRLMVNQSVAEVVDRQTRFLFLNNTMQQSDVVVVRSLLLDEQRILYNNRFFFTNYNELPNLPIIKEPFIPSAGIPQVWCLSKLYTDKNVCKNNLHFRRKTKN